MALIDMQKSHSKIKNSQWVNQKQDILIERIDDHQLVGRNDANVLVYCPKSGDLIQVGDLVTCMIQSATPHGLKACVHQQ
jgi:tRNA A37 methylthiotransferase MiaB